MPPRSFSQSRSDLNLGAGAVALSRVREVLPLEAKGPISLSAAYAGYAAKLFVNPAVAGSYSTDAPTVLRTLTPISAPRALTLRGSTTFSAAQKTITLANASADGALNVSSLDAGAMEVRSISVWFRVLSAPAVRYFLDARPALAGGFIQSGGVGSDWSSSHMYVGGSTTQQSVAYSGIENVGQWRCVTLVRPAAFTGAFRLFGSSSGGEGLHVEMGPVLVSSGETSAAEHVQFYRKYLGFTFSAHTFTTGGATGRLGPTLAQVRTAYASEQWAQDDDFLTMLKSGIQLWTVPETGVYRIEAFGASHSRNASTTNGAGARMRGDFSLVKGERLEILVGQQGVSAGNTNANRVSGSGGSFVVRYSPSLATLSTADKIARVLVIAGGGGGVSDVFATDAGAQVLSLATTAANGQNSRTNTTDGGIGGADGLGNGGGGCQGGTGFLTGYCVNLGVGGDNGTGSPPGGFGGGGAIRNSAASQSAGGGGFSGGGATVTGYSGGGGSYNAGTNQSNAGGANVGVGRVTIARV